MQLTPKQLILRELNSYLQLRNNWFSGFFFLMFSCAVTQAKINLVTTFMQIIAQTDGNKLNFNDKLKKFKQNHSELINRENKARLFTWVGAGNLGKRIKFIEAELTKKNQVNDSTVTPNFS